MESLHFGVPVVACPGFGDQPSNAQRAQRLRLGRCVLRPREETEAARRGGLDRWSLPKLWTWKNIKNLGVHPQKCQGDEAILDHAKKNKDGQKPLAKQGV